MARRRTGTWAAAWAALLLACDGGPRARADAPEAREVAPLPIAEVVRTECTARGGRACTSLGMLEVWGVGVPRAPREGLRRLETRCDEDDAEACTLRAAALLVTGDRAGAATLDARCARDDALACWWLVELGVPETASAPTRTLVGALRAADDPSETDDAWLARMQRARETICRIDASGCDAWEVFTGIELVRRIWARTRLDGPRRQGRLAQRERRLRALRSEYGRLARTLPGAWGAACQGRVAQAHSHYLSELGDDPATSPHAASIASGGADAADALFAAVLTPRGDLAPHGPWVLWAWRAWTAHPDPLGRATR